jgi:cytochrome c5
VDQETGPELEEVEEDVHQETAQEVENQVCNICHGTQYGSFAEGMPCRHDSYFHWRCRMIDFQSC